MKWKEARKLFPNQFLLVSILDYHLKKDKRIVDDVAIIRPVKDEDANQEFYHAKKAPWSTTLLMKTSVSIYARTP